MKTEILKIKGDWQEVVDDCRSTVGKPPLGHEPSEKFKRDILIAEHSPIRDISVKWIWRGIWSYIATHWSRHKWECFIKSHFRLKKRGNTHCGQSVSMQEESTAKK